MARKSNKSILLINSAILLALGIALYGLSKQKQSIVQEGITNMNCCGGIVSGTHYQETDTEPPEYMRRCFTSERSDTGEVEYDWHGFPCSTTGSGECCPGLESRDARRPWLPTNKRYCKVQGDAIIS